MQPGKRGNGFARPAFRAGALLLLLLTFAAPAELLAASVLRVRFSSNPERTRVVLDLDRPAEFRHQAMADPPRVLVEFPRARFSGPTGPISIRDGFVNRVRRNALRDGRIQVVLDLDHAADYRLFTLEKPDRIVVDVKHGTPPPPAPEPPAKRPEPARRDPRPATPKPKPEAPPAAKETVPPPSPAPEPTVLHPPRLDGPWLVAVDAGHGGQDHGARYHGASEKDITLDLAKKLVEELNRRPGVEAFLTRKGDYFIPLWQRWSLAENKQARAFVSLHCNASRNRTAKGTEVFFLSLEGASDQATRELAERENAVDEKMGVAPREDLDKILFDMGQTEVLKKSEILAEICLEKLFGLGTVYSRGVKQAGFTVLRSPRMPSILVEAAFISNKRENKMLRDGGWQSTFARLLADGIEAYRNRIHEAE